MDIESNRVSIKEHRVEYNINNLIEEVKKSVFYEHAKDWCDIVIEELNFARDEITFFFRHVWEVAKNHDDDSWPIDNTIWAKAVESWFEGKVLYASDPSFI